MKSPFDKNALVPLGRPINNAYGQINPGALSTEAIPNAVAEDDARRKNAINALKSAAPYAGKTIGKGA